MSDPSKPSYALLLSSEVPTNSVSFKLVSGGHRYCTAMGKQSIKVECLCEGSSSEEADRRLRIRDQITELLQPMLAKVLNSHHGQNFSEKEWFLLTGHWVSRFVSAFVQRYLDLEQLSSGQFEYESIVLTYSGEPPKPAPSTGAATSVFNSEEWDVYAKLRILRMLKGHNVALIRNLEPIESTIQNVGVGPVGRLKSLLIQALDRASAKTSRGAKLFIISSYLPFWLETTLHLRWRQMPQIWNVNQDASSSEIDRELRLRLSSVLIRGIDCACDALTQLVTQELFVNLPSSFLEQFDLLPSQARRRGWPSVPKILFTSNAFDGDDIFKRYAVDQVRAGAKYVVGQHGNNYGTLRSMSPTVEERTADTFITWGWKGDLRSHKPGFVLKLGGRVLRRKRSRRYLLLQLHLDNNFNLFDSYFEHERYFESQLAFAKSLDDSILGNLFIRLHPSSNSIGWGERDKWRQGLEREPNFSKNSSKIYSEFECSQLVIHSYDSTGLLECLSQNIPTVAFWSGELNHLQDSVKPHYELLVAAGIVHFDPTGLANHINALGYRVESWWASDEVQKARLAFCEEFARTSKNPSKDLLAILGDKK